MLSTLIAERGSPPAEVAEARLLERVALALNSTLELNEVLRLLAETALGISRADRCSIFLLEGKTLHPAAAIGRIPNEDLWGAFREMGPIDVDEIPHGWELMVAGRAVTVFDARVSELIPDPWMERFNLRSLVLVPLMVEGDPCGLMAVDHQEPKSFSDDEVRILEAMGSYAAVAVRNARLYEATCRRSALQQGLARAAAALVSPLGRSEISVRIVDAYADLFGARLCAIGLVDSQNTEVEIVATRGTRRFTESLPVAEIPERVVTRLRDAWNDGHPIEFTDDPWLAEFVGGKRSGVESYLLIPLLAGQMRGGVLLGLPRGLGLDTQELSAAVALAAIASAALERTQLLSRLAQHLRRTEILHALGDALAEHADARALTRKLNRLLADQGIEVRALTFRDPKLARRLGGEEPTNEERQAWKNHSDYALNPDGTLSVPMRLGRRLVGAARVWPSPLQQDERAFLEALAHGVAEVASRGALRADVEEAERERAVSAERGRIAADLHDTAGQLFVAIGLLARREATHLPEESLGRGRLERLAELADAGKWEISRAIQALAFFPEAGRGVAASVRALARSFESDSGIETLVDVGGAPARLSPRAERALYRVAHEALTNAWRHARCARARVSIAFDRSEVVLNVMDDGIGIKRDGGANAPGVGISSMRRALNEVGGTLKICSVKPNGTLVEARVSRESK